MYKKFKFAILLFVFLLFFTSSLYARERLGVIYPSLFITEELASFTQAISYFRDKTHIETYVVNSKPEKEAILKLYKTLKEMGVGKFIVKDEGIDLSFLYKASSKKDLFFSFSPSITLIKDQRVKRVVPTYFHLVENFKTYVEKRGSPLAYILLDHPSKKDISDIKGLFSTYKGKWGLFMLKDLFTPFGLTDRISFDKSYIFLYPDSYKKGAIFIQLLSSKVKNFNVVIPEKVLSPSFLALTDNSMSHIFIESDISTGQYKNEYNSFKEKLPQDERICSLYDFAKVSTIYDAIEKNKRLEELFSITIRRR